MLTENKVTKKLVSAALLVAMTSLYVPAFADTTIFANGQDNYGANISSMTNAKINENTGKYAQIGIQEGTQGGTIKWTNLNTRADEALDFKFTGAGQYALNQVIGNSMSKFAGSLTTSGEKGRLIISNPSGIFFQNGSYTNVNDLTLTTHNASIDNQNKLQLDGNNSINDQGVKIGDIHIINGELQNAAVMRLSNDLNIISNGIKIENADILAGKNVRLITNDGVNFIDKNILPDTIAKVSYDKNAVPAPINFNTATSSCGDISSSILVKDSAIAVKDDTNGKIYFISKGGNINSNIAAINSALDGKTALNVDGNATFEVIGNLDLSGIKQGSITSKVGGNLIAKTVESSLNLKNDKIFNGLTQTTTLAAYIASNYGNNVFSPDAVKKFLEANKNGADKVSSDLINDVYKNASKKVWKSTTDVYKVATDTTYSGKGMINLANTTVSGEKVDVNGAGVRVYNLSAKNAEVTLNSTAEKTAVSAKRNTEESEFQKGTKIAQYLWNGKYTTTTTPIYGYVWQNNNGESYVVSYKGDQLAWNGKDWVNLSTGKLVNLNLKIVDGKYESVVTKTKIYWSLKGGIHIDEYQDSVPIMYDKKVNKRWEVDEYHGILAILCGLSAGDKITDLSEVSNMSKTNAIPTFDASIAKGLTIGNCTSNQVKTGETKMTEMTGGELAIDKTKTILEPTFSTPDSIEGFLHTAKAGSSVLGKALAAGEIKIDNHETTNSPNIQMLGSLIANADKGITIYNDGAKSEDIYNALKVTGNTTLTADSYINVSNFTSGGDLSTNSKNKTSIKNSNAYSVLASAAELNLEDSTITENAKINTTGNITIKNLNKNSNSQKSTINAKSTEGDIKAENVTIAKDLTFEAKNISVEGIGSTVGGNAKLKAHSMLDATNLDITGDLDMTAYSGADKYGKGVTLKNIKAKDINLRSASAIVDFDNVVANSLDATAGWQFTMNNSVIPTAIINMTAGKNYEGFKPRRNVTITGISGQSQTMSLTVTNANDINLTDLNLKNSSLAESTGLISINSSKINNSKLNTTGDVNLNNSTSYTTEIINSENTIIGNNTYFLGGSIANATNSIVVNSGAKIGNVTLNSKGSVKIDNAHLYKGTTNITGNTVNINNLDLWQKGNLNINSTNETSLTKVYGNELIANSINGTINIDSSIINETINLTAGKDIILSNVSAGKDITTKSIENTKILGTQVGGNLNILGAQDLTISNSTNKANSGVQTIEDLAQGKTPINDYNDALFTAEDFEKTEAPFGSHYGQGSQISIINGNLNVSNVNNANVINSAILGDYNVSNVSENANLITSYVGKALSQDRATIAGDGNVYLSYVNEYTPYYMIPTDYSSDDVNRLKYGNELDTAFRRQFSPKGFAADDDEIKARITKSISSAKQGKDSSIILGEAFIAD